jgi:site-specific recombinase XerD
MENQSNSHQKKAIDLQKLINSFAQYLKQSRGLAPRTIKDYCADTKSFLQILRKGNKIRFDRMSSKQVIRSFLNFTKEKGRSRAQHIIYALRSFFRYLKQAHLIEEDLTSALPSVANRKKTSYPDVLSSEMMNKLLESCDRTGPLGKRNYAILLLMITLGLRSCEVCDLKLSDLDWERGELIVRGKGSEDSFPIFQEMGKALVDYLKYGRPDCESIKVFIRSVHPFKGITTACIRNMVSSTLSLCGLSSTKKGAHLLRHSFAMQLLEKGATLEEIGVILRHKDIEATAIYAQASFARLEALVQPWPQFVKMEGSHD